MTVNDLKRLICAIDGDARIFVQSLRANETHAVLTLTVIPKTEEGDRHKEQLVLHF